MFTYIYKTEYNFVPLKNRSIKCWFAVNAQEILLSKAIQVMCDKFPERFESSVKYSGIWFMEQSSVARIPSIWFKNSWPHWNSISNRLVLCSVQSLLRRALFVATPSNNEMELLKKYFRCMSWLCVNVDSIAMWCACVCGTELASMIHVENSGRKFDLIKSTWKVPEMRIKHS